MNLAKVINELKSESGKIKSDYLKRQSEISSAIKIFDDYCDIVDGKSKDFDLDYYKENFKTYVVWMNHYYTQKKGSIDVISAIKIMIEAFENETKGMLESMKEYDNLIKELKKKNDTCLYCLGTGKTTRFEVDRDVITCPHCKGTGKFIDRNE